MANQNAPFGLGAITSTGAAHIGEVNKYYIPATDSTITAVGDPVTTAGSADADGTASIKRAGTTDVLRGYIVGFSPLNRDQENLPNYRPAGVETYALVCDAPNARFVIQEDSVGGALTANDVGLNAAFVVSDANATTGRSQVMLDSSSAEVTATLPFKVLELYQDGSNVIGDYAKWVCSFNAHELKTDTGSLGK